jgi:hypothetical protein
MLAFVGDQVGEQPQQTFPEPAHGGALVALSTVNIDDPSQAVIDAHHAQAHAPVFLPSATAGVATNVMEACMIPLMWAPCFVMGGTPKDTLDKIDLLVASVLMVCKFMQEWGRCVCAAAAPIGAEVNQSSISAD